MIKETNSKNTLKFAVYYALMFMANSVFSTYIPLYYKNQGFDLTKIGLLAAIGPILTILVQPLFAKLCDRAKKRSTVLIAVLTGAMLTDILFPFLHSFIFVFIMTSGYMVFNTSIIPISDTISTESLRKHGGKFSLARMGGTVGYVLSVIFAGLYFKDHLGNMFYVQACLYLLLILYVIFMGREENTARAKKETKSFAVLKNKEFLFILLFMLVVNIAVGFNNSFLSVRVNELHCSNEFVGYCFGLASLTEIPVMLLMPKLYKKWGVFPLLFISSLSYALRMLLCAYATSIGLILAAQLFQGFAFITSYYATVNYVSENLPEDSKSVGQGLLAVAETGFGCIIGSVGGGIVSDRAGIGAVFEICGYLLIILTAVSVIYLYIKKTKRKADCNE